MFFDSPAEIAVSNATPNYTLGMKRALVGLAVILSSLALAIGVGDKAPLPEQFTDSFGKTVKLEDRKWVVLYFYPKAFTAGCTAQNIEYTKIYKDFLDAGAQVFAVSNDSSAEQCAFVKQYSLKIPQIPDTKAEIATKFDVGGIFGFYSRDTIIVSPDGKVAQIRRNVNAVSDAREVLAFIKSRQ